MTPTTSFLLRNYSVHHEVTVAWIFNYAYILIVSVNFGAPFWKIFIICARSLFAAMTPYSIIL